MSAPQQYVIIVVCLFVAAPLVHCRSTPRQLSSREKYFQDNTSPSTESPQALNDTVTNLESLLLQMIDVGGPGICLSSVAKQVMQGFWRGNNIPQDEELKASIALRKRCYDYIPSASALTFKDKRPKVKSQDNVNSVLPPDPDTLQKVNEILKDKSADCKPRKISVEIPKDPNPMIRLLPGCAMIERCGGCCKHEALECVPDPNGITMIRKKVVAMSSTASQMTIKQVSIEKHSKCRCECKVKAQHCNERQNYDSKNCRCLCRVDQNGKPVKGRPSCSDPLYWDDSTCRCRCPPALVTECSTGSYYDTQLCRCVTADDIIGTRSHRG